MQTTPTASVTLLAAILTGCAGCMDRHAAATVATVLGPDPGAADIAPLAVVPASDAGNFAGRIAYGDRELVRNGSALAEWGFFGIDLYRAALYVERRPASVDEALAADQVMVIHLEFVRELTTAQLRDAFTGSVKVNTGEAFPRHEESLGRLLDTMHTVPVGEAYTFVLDPMRGLLVQRGGETLARIADDAFRRLFARLYLGDLPPTRAVREGLLGGIPR